MRERGSYNQSDNEIKENKNGEKNYTLEQLQKWNTYGFDIYTNSSEQDLSLIILGEAHLGVFIPSQLELIEQVKPQVILHENLHGCNYDPHSQRIAVQEGREAFKSEDKVMAVALNELMYHTRDAANRLKIPIIGCDLSMKEYEEVVSEIFHRNPDRFEVVEGESLERIRRLDTGKVVSWGDADIMRVRDERMVSQFERYAKASGTIIAVIGAAHGENIMKDQNFLDLHIPTAFVDQPAVLDKVKEYLEALSPGVKDNPDELVEIYQAAFDGKLFT